MPQIMPQPDAFSSGPSPTRLVFVYGTLRRGEERDINRLLPAPTWIGDGVVEGTLFNLGSYPGIVLGQGPLSGRVVGEVYRIAEALERQLDIIEEVWPTATAIPNPSSEYTRSETVAYLAGRPNATPQTLRCLVYEASRHAVAGKPVLSNGDWVVWRRSTISR
jgi:gamma-glutamylcyclotransferase (GGCT)/AIG2-like uncharacterized protein YtfP